MYTNNYIAQEMVKSRKKMQMEYDKIINDYKKFKIINKNIKKYGLTTKASEILKTLDI